MGPLTSRDPGEAQGTVSDCFSPGVRRETEKGLTFYVQEGLDGEDLLDNQIHT